MTGRGFPGFRACRPSPTHSGPRLPLWRPFRVTVGWGVTAGGPIRVGGSLSLLTLLLFSLFRVYVYRGDVQVYIVYV
jgi:hypothetical protein